MRRRALLGGVAGAAIATGAGAVPFGFWAASNAFDLQYAAGIYSTPSGTVADPVTAGLVTASFGSGTRYGLKKSGAWQPFSGGLPRLTDLGLMLEPAGTNLAPNGQVDGAVGSLPNGWVVRSNTTGITPTITSIIAADSETGFPMTRLTLTGTATTGSMVILFHGFTAIAATASQQLCGSLFYRVVSGGSTSSNSFFYATPGTASGSATGTQVNVPPQSYMTSALRYAMPITMPATTGTALIGMQINCVAGAQNWVFDVGCVQVEANTQVPSSPMVGTGTTTTRSADTLDLAGPMLAAMQGVAKHVEITSCQPDWTCVQAGTLVAINGAAQLAITSGFGVSGAGFNTVKTVRKGNWLRPQKARVSFGASNLAGISSGASADYIQGTYTAPTVSSVSIGRDSAASLPIIVNRLRVVPEHRTDLTDALMVASDHIAYGMTPAAITSAMAWRETCAANANPSYSVIIGGWRDRHLGGMLSGGLRVADVPVPPNTLTSVYGNNLGVRVRIRTAAVDRGTVVATAITGAVGTSPTQELTFEQIVAQYKIPVYPSTGVVSATKTGATLTSFTTLDGLVVRPTYWTDGSYEADLLTVAGCTMSTVREAADSNNALNGIGALETLTMAAVGVTSAIDPYVTPGNAASGLLPDVAASTGGATGAQSTLNQMMNFRIALDNGGTGAAWPTVAPRNYNASRYEYLGRKFAQLTAAGKTYGTDYLLTATGSFGLVKGSIYDLNDGPFLATDFQSPGYLTASYAQREIIWQGAIDYTMGLFYYLLRSGDSRIPSQFVTDLGVYKLPIAHFTDPRPGDPVNWPYQMYVRDPARLKGNNIVTQSDINATNGAMPRLPNVVGVGSYPGDRHKAQLVNNAGSINMEGHLGIASGGANNRFVLPYDLILPKRVEVTNGNAGFGGSATSAAISAIRLEDTSMSLGHVCGTSAALAFLNGSLALQDVSITLLQSTLIAQGQIIQTLT